MLRRALVVLGFGFMTVFMASCGSSNELQSITLSPVSPNLEGIGGSKALVVTAHYSNTKTEDVTVRSTYAITSAPGGRAPMGAVTVSASGILQVVESACTWTATLGPDGKTYVYSTTAYTVVATYSGFTSTAFVAAASAGNCFDGQEFPAPPVV
jgi:hypothetical protein